MQQLARRGFLKAMAAAPLGAQAAVDQLALQAAGITGVGAASPETVLPGAPSEPVIFRDFASWLHDFGEKRMKEEARDVRRLDPDIISFRLPLTTKVRMQRERNYQRLLEERKDWFANSLKLEGHVRWWP